MFKGILIAFAAAALLTGCATTGRKVDCAAAVAKAQKIRTDLQAAQAGISALCAAGVASKECREEIQVAARIHAALDLAFAVATGVCPNVTLGAPPSDAAPAPAAKSI